MKTDIAFVDIDWAGRRVRIEHRWIGRAARTAPLIVFLHEGLGSLAMRKDFPHRLCAADFHPRHMSRRHSRSRGPSRRD